MTARSNYHNFHFLLIVRLLKCHYLGRPCESNCTSMKNLDVLALESICISLHIQMYQILHKCGKSLPHFVESILHIMWKDPATICGRLSFSVSFGQFIQFFRLMFLGFWNLSEMKVIPISIAQQKYSIETFLQIWRKPPTFAIEKITNK